MKNYLVKKSSLKGEITIPPSKSHTLRAILFGALGNGKSVIRNFLVSPDSQAMIEACRLMGAKINISDEHLEIEGLDGVLGSAEDVINAGNSGIVLRFISGIGALSHHPVVITGDHSIRHNRPMKELLSGLSQLGVQTSTMRGDDFAPVIVKGPIKSGTTRILGEDSQPVSALLIACAFSKGPFDIFVDNPGEKPWIGLTLDWFDRLGISYKNRDFCHYSLPGFSRYPCFEYSVPGDLSSLAFPIAAALVTNSELVVNNVDMSDSQGDKELINVFQKMGAKIEIDQRYKRIYVKKGETLIGGSFDINNFVDAVTILAAVSLYAEGETIIKGCSIARTKECNRLRCVKEELQKLGGDVTETEDGLIIKKSNLKGANLNSHNDHRMVMSLAVAAMGAEGVSRINDVECVVKTFPNFAENFKILGADVETVFGI